MPTRTVWIGWLVLLMVGCGFISVLHGADAMWDTKNYHLYNAFAAYHNRYNYDIAPAQQQSYLNPILDYPFYFSIRLFNDYPRFVAFLMGLPQGVNLWLIGIISWQVSNRQSRVMRTAVTLIATWIGATGAGTLPLVGSPTGDILVSIPVLGAFATAMRVASTFPTSPRRARLEVLICGFLAGIAVGAKPTAACFAIGFCIALLVTIPWRALPGILLGYMVSGIVGALLTGGYHAFRLFKLFGNPIFPLFNDVFRSPYWENSGLRDTRFLPRTILEALHFPFAWAAGVDHGVAAELGFRDIRVALSLSALVLALIVMLLAYLREGTAIHRGSMALFVSVGVSYIVWIKTFAIYRYLLPIEMLSGAILVAAFFQIARPVAVPILMTASVTATWFTTTPLEWGHTPFLGHYVEVSAPHIEPGTMVLNVGSDPVAFLIPFFDPGVRWLSLNNNLLRPEQGNALVARERSLIAGQKGPILALHAGASSTEVETTLDAYGLVENPNRCQSISSSLGSETYALCAVSRQQP